MKKKGGDFLCGIQIMNIDEALWKQNSEKKQNPNDLFLLPRKDPSFNQMRLVTIWSG